MLHLIVQSLDVLDIHGRYDAYSRIEELHDILPPLWVDAALDIRMGQFIHDYDFRVDVQHLLDIHLFQFFPLVEKSAARNERKPRHEGLRFRTAVRLDISDTHIDTGFK